MLSSFFFCCFLSIEWFVPFMWGMWFKWSTTVYWGTTNALKLLFLYYFVIFSTPVTDLNPWLENCESMRAHPMLSSFFFCCFLSIKWFVPFMWGSWFKWSTTVLQGYYKGSKTSFSQIRLLCTSNSVQTINLNIMGWMFYHCAIQSMRQICYLFNRTMKYVAVCEPLNQWILKGEVSLYHWPPVWLVWNQLYDNWQFLFLFTKQTNPNQSNRRSTVKWYVPL